MVYSEKVEAMVSKVLYLDFEFLDMFQGMQALHSRVIKLDRIVRFSHLRNNSKIRAIEKSYYQTVVWVHMEKDGETRIF